VQILGGGFVTGVTFSPLVKGLVYARTDVGGAYRLDPGSEEWVPLTDWLGRDEANWLGIESLALDPTDPERVFMAAGMYTKSWGTAGAMLRSKDRGRAWAVKPMAIKMGGNENGRSCGERLVVDPNRPSRILFGSRQAGLLLSEDGGESWTPAPGLPKGTGNDPIGIAAIVFDARSGAKGQPTPVIYAAAENAAGSVFRSRDAGKTWAVLPGQPQKMLACHLELDHKGMLYVTYANGPGPNDISDGAVYVLDPKSGAAKDVTPLRPAGEDKFGYAGLALDPAKPGTILVTTIDRWTKRDDIFRTTDGGRTWKSIGQSAKLTWGEAEWFPLHRAKVDVPGWMGDIDIDPFDPDHATFVMGAGVWTTQNLRRADAGEQVEFRFTNHGLEETCANVLVSPPAGAPLLSGVADICGLRHEDLDHSPSYGAYDPACQGTTGLDFAERDPNLFVRTGTVWAFGPGPHDPHGVLSTDGGKTWRGFPQEPPGAERGGMVAITADGSSIVWTMKDSPPVYSRDRGQTWQAVKGVRRSAKLPDWTAMDLQPAADRVDPKRVAIYDALEATLYVSRDGGASFVAGARAMSTVPDYQLILAHIKAVPGHAGHLWLSTGKELFRSMDGGLSVEAQASVEESYSVAFGRAAPGAAYPTIFVIAKIGGKKGFFRSTDQGKSWVRVNDDAHQYGSPYVIEGDPRVFGRVYVGASGRGIVVGEPLSK
jgi:photosystem II stability/assembly factor-like uncharacterized protein